MNVFIEELIKQYKRDNNINNKEYSEKIKARFHDLEKGLVSFEIRKESSERYVKFSSIIYKKLKGTNVKLNKSQLGNLIRIKFEKELDVKFRMKKEANKLNRLIEEKFTKFC